MTPFVAGGAGFLLSVLWFDLIFDVQVLRRDGHDDVSSISAYYRRVTTTRMSRLVGVVMLATLVAIAGQIAQARAPGWAGWASLALAGSAVALAAAHTFPSARRLGAWPQDAATRHQLARAILRDHVACLTAIVAVLVIQLAFAR